jgi:Phage integrase, N-terminal SAM-like domain
VSRVYPVGGDLAGRWLSRFLTSYLAAERDLSPQTVASYRDAVRLLLTWFRDVQGTPPEKLRLADLDRARVLCFLAERGNSAATRSPAPACGAGLAVSAGDIPVAGVLQAAARTRQSGASSAPLASHRSCQLPPG